MKTDNELIARFMELKEQVGNWRQENPPNHFLVGKLWIEGSELEYHKNWNWLMPVVEKIESIRAEQSNGLGYEFAVIIQENECIVESHTRPTGMKFLSFRSNAGSKIKSIYKAVVEFIKWYNEQKKS